MKKVIYFENVADLKKHVRSLGKAFTKIFDCHLIDNDWSVEMDSLQKSPFWKDIKEFRYSETLFVRNRGVEWTERRVKELNDEVLVVVKFGRNENGLFCSCEF